MIPQFDRDFLPELWAIVATHLRNHDLSKLSQTSKTMCQIIRPILYRSVCLMHSPAMEPAKLLCKDSNLAGYVQKFTIKLVEDPGVPVVDALVHMTALRELSVEGTVFFKESDQRQFLEHFNKTKFALEYFCFIEIADVNGFFTEGAGFSGFPLVHLRGIFWGKGKERAQIDSEFGCHTRDVQADGFSTATRLLDDEYYESFRSGSERTWRDCLTASMDTMESISIMPFISEFNATLWDFRFPNLRELMLGDVWYRGSNVENHDYIEFLLSHPKLETLYFGHDVSVGWESHWISESPHTHLERISDDALGSLMKFKGSLNIFGYIFQFCAKSVRTSLRSLELETRFISHGFGSSYYLMQVLSRRQARPVFPCLERLCLRYTGQHDYPYHELEPILMQWTSCCGKSLQLLQLFASSSADLSLRKIAESRWVKRFQTLKFLTFHVAIKLDREHFRDDMKILARRCPTLECLLLSSAFYDPPYNRIYLRRHGPKMDQISVLGACPVDKRPSRLAQNLFSFPPFQEVHEQI